MAPLSNYISFLFLTTLLLPLQIIARESQFFSKVTHFNNNNNVKETEEIPNKDVPAVTNKPEQQPTFIPETENSYGLYGHDDEPAQLPSTTAAAATTAANQPHNTEFEDTSKYPNNKHSNYYNNDAYNTRFYNKDAFGNNQDELSYRKEGRGGYNSINSHIGNNQDELSYTKVGRGGYNSPNQNYKQEFYLNNDKNAANERFYNNNNNKYDGVNNRYNNVEKQGMSDTRFLEGGKYYYDLNTEKYNPTLYDDSYKGVNTNNWYNNRRNSYGNNNNNKYQNQEEFEDEQNEFEP